jgi:hypothetical protein
VLAEINTGDKKQKTQLGDGVWRLKQVNNKINLAQGPMLGCEVQLHGQLAVAEQNQERHDESGGKQKP